MVKLKLTSKANLRQRNLAIYSEATKAALAVQRWYRGWKARQEVGKVRNATIKIQAGARGRLERKRLKNENEQAKKIQCLYRGHRARRSVNETIQEQTCDLAATMVQSRLRAVIMRRRLRKTLGCARKLQAAWRGYYVRRKFREEYDRKAQIIIQSRMFESKKVQWYLERERQVMRGKIAVFREWAHSAGKRRALARQRDSAAVAIQRCFRGHQARRERARLRNERQRGKELSKFVELLRSHMSMVIFEEKERHTLAFPVRGKGKGKKGEVSRRTVALEPLEDSRQRSHPASRSGGSRRADQSRGATQESRRQSNTSSARRGSGSRRADRSRTGNPVDDREHSSRVSRGSSRGRGAPEGGGGTSNMRKAELEDALALADLLNLPGGGGGRGSGNDGGGRRGRGGTKKLPTSRKPRADARLPAVRA